jgi:hypothetical protein
MFSSIRAALADVAKEVKSSIDKNIIQDENSSSSSSAASLSGQIVDMNGRQLRVLRTLGEGGFSFVYLVGKFAHLPCPVYTYIYVYFTVLQWIIGLACTSSGVECNVMLISHFYASVIRGYVCVCIM